MTLTELLPPVLNFFAVLTILFLAGKKPFGAFLSLRSETVKKEMGEAELMGQEAEKMLKQWESNYQNQEAHAKQSIEETKVLLAKQKEKALVSARAEAERVKREAQMMGTQEVQKAKLVLQKEIAQKSVDMAEQFLGRNLDPKDKSSLVAEYVELVNGTSR